MSNYQTAKLALVAQMESLERSQERLANMVSAGSSKLDREFAARQWSLQNEELSAVKAALNQLDLAMQAQVECRAFLKSDEVAA